MPQKKPSLKIHQKAMKIVDNRLWRAVTGACLTVSKQVFNSLALLVDSKLNYFVAIYT